MIFPHFTRFASVRFFTVFLLCLLAFPVAAQDVLTGQTGEPADTQPWQPPDITDLQIKWWEDFSTDSPDELLQRLTQFSELAQQKIQGLEGEELASAQEMIKGLGDQAELLALALRGLDPMTFDPIPKKDAYELEDLLALRGKWREIRDQLQVPELRADELKSRASFLRQRQDELLSDYDVADSNSPERIILGLQRVTARLEFQLTNEGVKYQEKRLDDLRKQEQLLEDQQEFARARLVSQKTDWKSIQKEAAAAGAEQASAASKVAALQHELIGVISAETPKPSLELLRRQQLTRALATQAQAQMSEAVDQARVYWHQFQLGNLPPGFDIGESFQASQDLLQAIDSQLELWTAASQTTLISPQLETDLNARKNVELAHEAAQETLAIIKEIRGRSDDLGLVEEILASDLVKSDSVFSNLGTRLFLFTGKAWHSMQSVLEFDLFHIGDAPVTPASIISMLLIIAFGYLLSWLIRHLLERLKERRKYAKSAAVYTLGRILHYIIILVAFLVALGTIGLDFTNFALIAGALSVGIGFGLQSIVNNFVSGLILLFEGSLRVGDYVELGTDLRGTVKEINTRATVINTNDSVDVVVPNSEFVSTRLTNWTLREPIARLRIDFGVAYGSDKEEVKAAALEAASEVEFILQHTPGREPQVWLASFGDSSLDFQLLAWVSKAGVRRPGRTRSQFLWALETKLTERGIEIPFPQRDLHLRTGFDQIPGGEPVPDDPMKESS